MLAERVKTWTEEWKQQGLEQGILLGEAMMLRRLLSHRFGPLPAWVETRLEVAVEAELETWADRMLDRATLEDVFAESR